MDAEATDVVEPSDVGPRPRRNRVPHVGAAVAVMLVVVVSVTLFVDRNTESVSNGGPAKEVRLRPVTAADGKPLPLEILPGFADGPPVDVGEFVGESLVVNFWATWCGPCVREMPMLRDMSSDMAGDVTFLGINVQDSPSQARAFLEDVGVEYVQAADPDGDYFRAVGGLGMPTTLLVDSDGVVRYHHTGELTAEKLRTLLKDHLGAS